MHEAIERLQRELARLQPDWTAEWNGEALIVTSGNLSLPVTYNPGSEKPGDLDGYFIQDHSFPCFWVPYAGVDHLKNWFETIRQCCG